MIARFLSIAPSIALVASVAAASLSSPTTTAAAPAGRDVRTEEANRALVLRFSAAAFDAHDFDTARTMLSPDYIQHNPRMASGREAFIAAYRAIVAARPGLHSTVLRSAAQGDLVFTHMRVVDADGGQTALVNIFRVQHGVIVEHWDVIQPVPPTSANANTMF